MYFYHLTRPFNIEPSRWVAEGVQLLGGRGPRKMRHAMVDGISYPPVNYYLLVGKLH